MSYGTEHLVEAPQRTPRPYGLFTAVTPITPDDPHWQNGIVWQNSIPTVKTLGDPGDNSTTSGDSPPVYTPPTKTTASGLPKTFESPLGDEVTAAPFTVYGNYQGPMLGRGSGYAEEQALSDLLLLEESAVENILWSGAPGNTSANNLVAEGATPFATAVDIKRAVALVEQTLATEYVTRGIIYLSVELASLAFSAGVIKATGPSVATALGTRVVVGAGFPGDSDVIYASGDVLLYRSEPFATPAYETGQNDAFAVAERNYVVSFDPDSVYAVTVALPASDGS